MCVNNLQAMRKIESKKISIDITVVSTISIYVSYKRLEYKYSKKNGLCN